MTGVDASPLTPLSPLGEKMSERRTGVEAVVWIAMQPEPKDVTIDGHPLPAAAGAWHPGSKTLLLRFRNSAQGHRISIR